MNKSKVKYICITLETLIKRKIVDYLNEKNLLSDCQHGFVKHRSTITNLVYFFNNLFSFSNNRFPMDVIFLDLSKAFDSVIHSKLICKIRSYGIKGRILNWIIDFLTNRTFCVNVNESFSPIAKVEIGTPRGVSFHHYSFFCTLTICLTLLMYSLLSSPTTLKFSTQL
jgi:hypothetical protein